MQIKRYEAKNMTLALRRVKAELGPDAVILSARTLRGGSSLFGKGRHRGVEVTAAVDGRHAGAGPLTDTDAASRTARPLNALQQYQAAAARHSKGPATPPGKRTATAGKIGSIGSHRPSRARLPHSGVVRALHQHLLNQDVERSIAARLVEELQRVPGIAAGCGADQIIPHLGDLLEEWALQFQPVGSGAEAPELIALVGPPGVGKTTTLAKLVTRRAVPGRSRVALVGMDGYRIGAVRELQTYADILQIPLAVLNTPAALRATLKRFKTFDAVYLDTAGIGTRDRERLEELQASLAKVKRKEVHLLLRADTKDRDLVRTIDRFKALPLSGIGFTHLDESTTQGVLVNILSRADLPLSILCSGQRIPEDLEDGSMDTLLKWVLKGFNRADGAPREDSQPEGQPQPAAAESRRYVANRNSDVYHVRHCKWTRKIKVENMVEFATIAEAELQRYLPCRTCKPDAGDTDDHASLDGDRVTLTGYR